MITVSIIEDQKDLRESIAKFIDSEPGFKCLACYDSAEEALVRLPRERSDVTLVDINLGGMDGIECVRRLKTLDPALNVLMLTVYEDNELIFRALAAGANGYLLKRLPPAKLIASIAEVHAGGSPMSAAIARKVVQSFQAARPAAGDKDQLSSREREVLESLARGYTYKHIAANLGISIDTIRTYIRRIYEKLHVHSRTEAVAKYARQTAGLAGANRAGA